MRAGGEHSAASAQRIRAMFSGLLGFVIFYLVVSIAMPDDDLRIA